MNCHSRGFTLIELSIVLVIIGLLVGGILIGQDLIKAAEVRAQISQIEKYNSAVNTFQAKYNAIPGDMALPTSNFYGFANNPNGVPGGPGCRDGNGMIEGTSSPNTLYQGEGETELFWQDLSSPVAGGLIEGTFPNNASLPVLCNDATNGTAVTVMSQYLPVAKIGHGNFIYVYNNAGYNWFAAAQVTGMANLFANAPSIPVIQAYNMDKKMDDGLPTTGAVQAVYVQGISSMATANAQSTDSTTSCYNTVSNTYSIGSRSNYGAGGNCALSFRFQ